MAITIIADILILLGAHYGNILMDKLKTKNEESQVKKQQAFED